MIVDKNIGPDNIANIMVTYIPTLNYGENKTKPT